MQSLYKFFKWAFGAWLLAAILVLALGIRSGPVAGGGVAMMMYFLGLPISVPVGAWMTSLGYPGTPNPGGFLVILLWAPFFIGGLIQGGIVLCALRYLAKRRK